MEVSRIYKIVWEKFVKYFPGFINPSASRSPFRKIDAKRKLDCYSYNRVCRRYERICIIIFVGKERVTLGFEVAISALPFPCLTQPKNQPGWAANLTELSKRVENLRRGEAFSLGQSNDEVDRSTEQLFLTVAEEVFRAFDEKWAFLLAKYENIPRILDALDVLRVKCNSILNEPDKISTEDIDHCFSDVGMPLTIITQQQISEFQEFYDSKSDEWWKSSDSDRQTIDEEIDRWCVQKKILEYGFHLFRHQVLEAFGRAVTEEEQFDKLLDDICLNLSKSGLFDSADVEKLEGLAKTFPKEKIIEIYVYFRDKSGRLESEWRTQFINLFPGSESFLPPINELKKKQKKK